MKSACVAVLAALAISGAAVEAQEVSSVALRRVSNNVASRPDSARIDSTFYVRSSGPRLTAGSGAAYGAIGMGLLAGVFTYMSAPIGCDMTVSMDGTSSCHPERTRMAVGAVAAVVGSAIGAVGGAIIGGIWDASRKPQSANKD